MKNTLKLLVLVACTFYAGNGYAVFPLEWEWHYASLMDHRRMRAVAAETGKNLDEIREPIIAHMEFIAEKLRIAQFSSGQRNSEEASFLKEYDKTELALDRRMCAAKVERILSLQHYEKLVHQNYLLLKEYDETKSALDNRMFAAKVERNLLLQHYEYDKTKLASNSRMFAAELEKRAYMEYCCKAYQWSLEDNANDT